MARVTLKDVADAAGVKPSTVSYILNNTRQGFAEDTVKRVKRLAIDMGYKPNCVARSLRAGHAEMLGLLLMPNIDVLQSILAYQIMGGVGIAAKEHGFDVAHILVSNTEDPEIDHISKVIQSRRIDGLILENPVRGSKILSYLQEMDFPFVVIGTPDINSIYWVDNDNIELQKIVSRHLLALGHRHFVLISPGDEYKYAIDREIGFRQAMDEAGIPPSDAQIVRVKDNHASASSAVFSLAKSGKLPSAICAVDDRLAAGIIHAINELGLCVPEDVSVTGCNNLPIIGDGHFLTTVELNMPAVGKAAAMKLMSLINGEETPQFERVPARLIERESVCQMRRVSK